MIGIISLAIFAAIGALMWFGYRVPYKYISKKYHSRALGATVGGVVVLIIFSIFFGDHIYKKWEYRQNCEKYTKRIVYDQEAYNRFFRVAKEYEHLYGKKVEKLKEDNVPVPANSSSAIFDKKDNYLYWTALLENQKSSINIKNLNNNQMIYEQMDYGGGTGGWLCKLMDFNLGRCGFGLCSSNKMGAFK